MRRQFKGNNSSKRFAQKSSGKSKTGKKNETIKVRESMGTGRLKIQNSAVMSQNDLNNVNYESEGDDAKMTFPGPKPYEDSRNVVNGNNSKKKKSIDLNTNLKNQKSDSKKDQSSKARNKEFKQADIKEIYEPEPVIHAGGNVIAGIK
jgi:hypothetical protein